jgi:hypothetical protein
VAMALAAAASVAAPPTRSMRPRRKRAAAADTGLLVAQTAAPSSPRPRTEATIRRVLRDRKSTLAHRPPQGRRRRRAVVNVRPSKIGPRGDRQLGGSRSRLVEVLQELMSGELDLLMSPLRGPVLTGDQAHPMDAAEIAIDERISSLRVVARTVGESEMPSGVLVPGVRVQKRVLVVGVWLNVAPHALEHVLACIDELSCLRDSTLIEGIQGHLSSHSDGIIPIASTSSIPAVWRRVPIARADGSFEASSFRYPSVGFDSGVGRMECHGWTRPVSVIGHADGRFSTTVPALRLKMLGAAILLTVQTSTGMVVNLYARIPWNPDSSQRRIFAVRSTRAFRPCRHESRRSSVAVA